MEQSKTRVPLKEYLENENLHEMVKENILAITMNFDKRVHAFINKIVMGKKSPMNTKFYHYRVEFQARGAGHIHGVLWVDVKAIQEEMNKRHNMGNTLIEAMDKLKKSATCK